MATFPRIQSPCPYRDRLSSVMEGDFCRLCERQVVDLGGMTDGERAAFLAGCAGEVCISYRLPLRAAWAAAAMAAAAVAAPTPAAAQDADASLDVEEMMIIVGGIRDPANIEFFEADADAAIPELPVTYEEPENDSARAKPAEAGETLRKDVSSPAGS